MKKIIVSKLFDFVISSICISIICATAFGICITKCTADMLNNEYISPIISEYIKDYLDELDITPITPENTELPTIPNKDTLTEILPHTTEPLTGPITPENTELPTIPNKGELCF